MDPAQRLKSRLIGWSLALSIALLLLKFSAYFLTNSKAILTDALESIVNVAASGFALYSIRLAGRPRDQNHPYGHGKIEFVSSGFEGAMIISAGLFILYEAIMSFFEPSQIENFGWGIGLLVLSTLLNAGLGWGLVRNGERLDSSTLVADGRHLLTDSFSTLVVLVGVALIWATGLTWLDSVLALGIALVILYSGFSLLRQALARLMDEADTPTLDRVATLLSVHKRPEWIDVHNLRVQKYGADLHIDCHLTLPYYWDLTRSHDEVRRFENTLQEGFTGEVEIFVHADPCLKECCHFCRVADCPVRAFPFVRDVAWTTENLPLNQKHYVPLITDTQ